MKTLVHVVNYLAMVAPLFPIVLFLILNNYGNKIVNLLFILLMASAFAELLTFVLFRLYGMSNILIVNIYFIVQLIVVAAIYYKLYLKKRGSLRIILISMPVVIILSNTFFWQGIQNIQNINWTLTTVLIAGMALGHLIYLRKNPVNEIRKYPPRWITTGLGFYCSFTFLLFALTKVFIEDMKLTDDFNFIWMFHNLNNIFKNVCFAMAIYWGAKRSPAWDVVQPWEN